MSKGSQRRPCAVSEEVFAKNWEATWPKLGKTPKEETGPEKDTVSPDVSCAE